MPVQAEEQDWGKSEKTERARRLFFFSDRWFSSITSERNS